MLGRCYAQAGFYKGGAGDGYDMGELVLRDVGVPELETQLAIYPTLLKSGQPVYISYSQSEEINWALQDMMGKVICAGNVQQETQVTTTGLPAGLYLLRLQHDDTVVTYKIQLVE